ncbi:IS1096 element passenger TnpR family protein [Dactylosporangium sp. CA-152071]|uniref:plasmid pRiA4b ORF-3 family protein n=1 Tax=Dactylosporangium sp. CA-152071 TaxID=3239933 RepID=UPI003D94D080
MTDIMVRARKLAEWVGAGGRTVTAKGVPRPADIPAAAAVAGVEVPAKVRSAADMEGLHRPWTAAVGAGYISIDGNRATMVDGPGRDPADARWDALLAVLAVESDDPRHEGALIACAEVLAALVDGATLDDLDDRVDERLEDRSPREFQAVYRAFRRGVLPVAGALTLLAEFGAVDHQGRLTALGRETAARLAVPPPVRPDLPVTELLARLRDMSDADAGRATWRWLDGRDLAATAAELLAAAGAGGAADRLDAFGVIAVIGDPALPFLRPILEHPMLAVHARTTLSDEEPSEADRCWLTVEVALAEDDPEERYHLVEECGGTATIEASDHPDRAHLLDLLKASGRPEIPVYELKVALSSTVWRRLRLPGPTTLEVLHAAIQVAFDWDDEHAHLFEAAGQHYSDVYLNLEDSEDESAVRLSKLLPGRGARMTYVYDLGDWWEHTITVERITVPEDPGPIACTAGAGDAPVEDWNEDDGPDTTPFDLDTINQRLAQLTSS